MLKLKNFFGFAFSIGVLKFANNFGKGRLFINFAEMKNGKYIFDLQFKVRDYEVDSEGIVNNAVYLHYLEHTRHEFCEWAGLSFREMHARGIDPVLSRVEINYRRPLRLGEHFISKLRLGRRGPLFVFIQDLFTPEGEVVVKAVVEVATLEYGRLTRGEVLAEQFAKYLEQDV